jgi:hypothetical protein
MSTICLKEDINFQRGEVILAHQLLNRGSIKKARMDHYWLHQSGPWQHGQGRSDLTTSSCKVLKRLQALLSSGGRSISLREMEFALAIRMQADTRGEMSCEKEICAD